MRVADRRAMAWLTAGLLVLALAGVLPAFGGELIFDDIALLLRYDCWHGLDQIPAMFTLDEANPCAYRPTRWATFAIDRAIGGGMNPVWMHISNLLYHLATGYLAFRLFRRFAAPLVALAAVALWLLHPVHTDSVAYISGRRDIVSTLLFLGALLLVLPAEGRRLDWRRGAGAIPLFYLAVQAKEMAVTLPVVALLGALVTSGRAGQHLRRYWPGYVALVGLAAAFVVYRAFLRPHSLMQGEWWGGSPVSNFATTFVLHLEYVRLWLWPSPLIGDYYPYTIPLAESFADPRALAGMAVDLSLLALAWLAYRRGWRVTAFGLGWYLVALLPVSHIIPHHELFAEHYLYLPSIGLCLALLPVLERLGRALARAAKATRAAAVAGFAALLVAMVLTSAARSGELVNEMAFYRAAYERAPENRRVLHYLSVNLSEQNRCDEALPLLAEAIRRSPPGSTFGRDERAAFLLCSDRLGRREGFAAVLEELLAGNPDDAYGLAWRARLLLETGRVPEAAEAFGRAVEAGNGHDKDAVAMWALALNRLGDHGGAVEVFERYGGRSRVACEQEVLARVALGVSHYPTAFERAQGCLERYPDSVTLLEMRAMLWASQGRTEEARADVARLEALGAPAPVIERLRGLLAVPEGP